MLFFLCSSNQKVINRYLLYNVREAHVDNIVIFLDYSIDESDITPS